jgi:hypothetical protein
VRQKHSQNWKNVNNSRDLNSRIPISIGEEVFLQPWFVSKNTFLAIRRLLPSAQLLRMKYYFEDYGCLRCGRSDVFYKANGFCKVCAIVVRCRLILALRRRFKKLGIAISDDPILGFAGVGSMKQLHRRTYYVLPGRRIQK